MRPLTEKQREALTFIATTIRLTQRPPTIIEVSRHMGSDNSRRGLGHIEALEKKGYLVREPGQARSIRLTPAGLSLFEKTGSSPPPGDSPSFCEALSRPFASDHPGSGRFFR